MLFLHCVGLVEPRHFKREMKQRTRNKQRNPLALGSYELLGNPVHGKKDETDDDGFQKNVHLCEKTDFF